MKKNKLFILVCSLSALFMIVSCGESSKNSKEVKDTTKTETETGELLDGLLVSEFIERNWTEPATGSEIQIKRILEKKGDKYIWNETFANGNIESSYFVLTPTCSKNTLEVNDENGTIISIKLKDASICYEPQALRMSDGSMKVFLTNLNDNSTRTLLEMVQ